MPNVYKIKKGLDLKLSGEAEKVISDYRADTYALKPTDFTGVFPKLMVKEGDKVKAGSPVFYNKYRDNIQFTSPVSGTVIEIKRGPKRILLEIRIQADVDDEYIDFGKDEVTGMNREDIVAKLLKSGLWPAIRQRPYSVIADPKDDPKAIYISAFDSAPLAPDYDYIVHGQGDAFQAGLDVLKKLTSGKIHLNTRPFNGQSKVFSNSKNVEISQFEGPHPAGNVGVQANKIDPIKKGDIIWYLRPQEVISIGKLFLEGKYDVTRIIALCGSEVKKPSYYRLKMGAAIDKLVDGKVSNVDKRYISGNVLTGEKILKTGYLGYYHDQVTVIPEGDYYEFFGWAAPGFQKFSTSRTFFSWMNPSKKWRMDTNLHGGHRAFVLTGEYEKVFPFDIYPMQLIKAIMVEDIDLMEQLGIYEVDEEDFALCELIDVSKTEMQKIVRQGLDLMRKEMT
ncbi:MAG: Na(+)-translocating NADH-quinone reductase subunit A [Bacteroidales bacterium]|nr:Na(+)-translocating NADH-quinone reductase subunit A [Bacteroidales bacterium]MCF8387247.1 Na(+)-translocating NADH-quinone reductase subunit A [Bacteroidales bacterium]MCF8396686.1 Na(+)-translocating NADH-quinone reductase subunit A [Bacteroidales bacterium]